MTRNYGFGAKSCGFIVLYFKLFSFVSRGRFQILKYREGSNQTFCSVMIHLFKSPWQKMYGWQEPCHLQRWLETQNKKRFTVMS